MIKNTSALVNGREPTGSLSQLRAVHVWRPLLGCPLSPLRSQKKPKRSLSGASRWRHLLSLFFFFPLGKNKVRKSFFFFSLLSRVLFYMYVVLHILNVAKESLKSIQVSFFLVLAARYQQLNRAESSCRNSWAPLEMVVQTTKLK